MFNYFFPMKYDLHYLKIVCVNGMSKKIEVIKHVAVQYIGREYLTDSQYKHARH
jgi:hypothetical protein